MVKVFLNKQFSRTYTGVIGLCRLIVLVTLTLTHSILYYCGIGGLLITLACRVYLNQGSEMSKHWVFTNNTV